ncbi:flagellar biosynthesis protein FliR [Janthinobacterium sp. CG_23.3]|uniref:flagellar biosynthetic protein FliR n=1 Tax=unclassified Janthinobacterium TaxID=2610881 RepID=UPI00034B5925|nr:flagellar biosynthetic protein FliR [Janthinobacterium sp. CG3]
MEQVFNQLLPFLSALWWPFCRILAMLTAAPVLGDLMVPVTVRVLVALVLAIVMLPMTRGLVGPIDPFSLHALVATVEQAVIGGVLGLAFHFSMSVIGVLGYLVSSQMGFSMAVMNDPINGTSSDVVSALLSILSIIVFFTIDGHLVIAGVIGASFHAWPLGQGYGPLLLQTVAYNVSWIFAAAMLLAIPIVFSTMVVQLGFGFLNRVAPSLNLFSLGFSMITLFGLVMLVEIIRFVPEHYIGMTNRVLEMLQQQMRAAGHG